MSETQTVTLTGFLLARIAEREAVARAAIRRWNTRELARGAHKDLRQHFIHHEPTRVLADCAALRRIVELHSEVFYYEAEDTGRVAYCQTCMANPWMIDSEDGDRVPEDSPCPTLRSLASVYADHPDYREEWRP